MPARIVRTEEWTLGPSPRVTIGCAARAVKGYVAFNPDKVSVERTA
jgi:hypothetical protein